MRFPATKNCLYIFVCLLALNSYAQRQMENLDRGVVAVVQQDSSVSVQWRILGTDEENLKFNLYRRSGKNIVSKLNHVPLSGPTHFIDEEVDLSKENTWFVKSVKNGEEAEEGGNYTLEANAKPKNYHSLPLKYIEGYTPNDASVADLDGDGEYEIILHQTGVSKDNSHRGLSDEPIFQAYKLDGSLLWEINLGKNIREGTHYTQFMMYDLDGDGKAEFVCKTADGTKDGLGNVIGDAKKDWRDTDKNSKTFGKILEGPEYFTVFDGQTGEALTTTDYIPGRGNISGWGGVGGNAGNDSTGNRVDRFTACVAYLDSERPSVIMGRGYYGRTVLAAWDFRNGELTSRWVFDSENAENPYSGMGNHNLSVADVDKDGKDEIVFGAMVVDDNGEGLYSTGFRHGDALHITDLDPNVPGLEVFGIHENEEGTMGPGVALFSGKDGEVLFRAAENKDIGRGVAANIDSTRKGAQLWWSGSKGLFDTKGKKIGKQPQSINFLIWWDGDSSRELLNRNYIGKYGKGRIFTAEGAVSNNGTKATPTLSADIWGDWREELILRSEDNKELRIYTTTIPTKTRQYTLMHDPQYRVSITWQNVGYNQPPHTSFYMGKDMKKAPKPKIKLVPEKLK